MGNLKYSVALGIDKDGKTQLRITSRGLYGILLLMHKSKGKYYFDILAVAFSISLMLFYISGFIVTSFCKNKRKTALIVFLAGFGTTALAIYCSI